MTEDQEKEEEKEEEFVPKKDFDKLKANTEILRRKLTKAQAGKLKTADLLKDPEFRVQALEHWEIPHDDDGNFKLPEELKDRAAIEEDFKGRLSKARTSWEKKELIPIKDSLSKFESENNALRKDVLFAALERSAKNAGVIAAKFKPIPFGNGKTSEIHLAAERFKFNSDYGRHILMSGEDPEFNATGDPIYADDFFKHFFDGADEDLKREWLGDNRQRGSNFTNKIRGRGAYTMTNAEAKASPSKYRSLKAAARAAGQSVQLID